MSAKKPATKSQEIKRRLKGERTIFHDLFRLEEKEVLKDIGWDAPKMEKFNHKHFFHTVDSDGKEQVYCTPSLGHTHEVKIVGQDESGEPIVEVGPAIVVIKKKGIKQAHAYRYDKHTHDATYLYSEELKVRKYNEEALAKISQMKAHEAAMSKSPTE